jgi:hypothetical protein
VEGQSGVPAPALSDAEAYDVIDRACSRDFTEGFRLYLIYSRAAAFESVGDTDDLIGP